MMRQRRYRREPPVAVGFGESGHELRGCTGERHFEVKGEAMFIQSGHVAMRTLEEH
jgi:hypothetical protein